MGFLLLLHKLKQIYDLKQIKMRITNRRINNLNRKNKYTTVELKVWGYRRECKARIENSLKVNGIIDAKWDRKTKILTAIFNPEIVSLEQIQNSFCMVAK